MTPFSKLWNTFVEAIKPPLLRQASAAGTNIIVIDTRPFTLSRKDL